MNLAFTYMLAGNRAARGTLQADCLPLWQHIVEHESKANPSLISIIELREKLIGTTFGEQTQNVAVGDGQIALKAEPALYGAVFRSTRKILRWPLYSADAETVAIASIGFDQEAIQRVVDMFGNNFPSATIGSAIPIALPITSLGFLEDDHAVESL